MSTIHVYVQLTKYSSFYCMNFSTIYLLYELFYHLRKHNHGSLSKICKKMIKYMKIQINCIRQLGPNKKNKCVSVNGSENFM